MTDADGDFGKVERLREVVVRPEFDALGLLLAGEEPSRHHDQDHILGVLSQLLTDLEGMRDGFKELSDAMIQYRDELVGTAPLVAYCPMVDALWLQSDQEIANPYFGSQMLRCGEIVRR